MSSSEANSAPTQPPVGLQARGARFWQTVNETWLIDADERELLIETCRQLDLCESLADVLARDGVLAEGSQGQIRAHPVVAELRAARLALARLVAHLDLPDVTGSAVPSATTVRARKAARARWGGRNDASTA